MLPMMRSVLPVRLRARVTHTDMLNERMPHRSCNRCAAASQLWRWSRSGGEAALSSLLRDREGEGEGVGRREGGSEGKGAEKRGGYLSCDPGFVDFCVVACTFIAGFIVWPSFHRVTVRR